MQDYIGTKHSSLKSFKILNLYNKYNSKHLYTFRILREISKGFYLVIMVCLSIYNQLGTELDRNGLSHVTGFVGWTWPAYRFCSGNPELWVKLVNMLTYMCNLTITRNVIKSGGWQK